MQLGRTILGWAVAAALLAACPKGSAQTDPGLVQRLEGQVASFGQPDWSALHKLILDSFPESKQYSVSKAPYYVWRIRSEDLVFQATNPGSADGDSSAGFYWFDLHSAPLAGTAFSTGHRSYFQNCALVSVPGISSYVVEATLARPASRPIQVDFGLDAYRPVLLRYASGDGSLLQNPYDGPIFKCGPRPPVYQRSDLLQALSGSNPQLQLEALTWLAARHSSLTADIVDVSHEPIDDSIRYWSLSNDSSVSQAAAALASSEVEWVSRAAKFFVSVSKPQTVPSVTLTPRLKDLATAEIRVGHGGDFDSRDRAVKVGDRVVVEYDITLSTGTTAFTNLNVPGNPPVFEVGSNQVIDGLSKGMIGMKVGGFRTIEVPARMAYGDSGADVIPPGADLVFRVRLLHIVSEPPFGIGSERVLRVKEMLPGKGPAVPPAATVNVTFKCYRLDGHENVIPDLTGTHQIAIFTGSLLKRELIGMKAGGVRRLLVNSPTMFGQERQWFHYSAQVLEIRLDSIVDTP